MWSLTAIRGPAAGSRIRCGADDAADAIREIAARGANRHHLEVLTERVCHLTVARLDLALDLRVLQKRLVGQRVHTGHQFTEVVGDDEVLAVIEEGLESAPAPPAGAVTARPLDVSCR